MNESFALDRRQFLAATGGAILASVAASSAKAQATAATPATTEAAPSATAPTPVAPQPEMARFPEKGELILQTNRPPNLESPLSVFQHDITPNELFYVRWHLAVLPTKVDLATFRLQLGGHVNTPLSLSMKELQSDFESVSVIAVNQCSGNSRSLYSPRMPGVQWGNGAIGNAKWTGVRLRDLLAKASVKTGAIDVSFNGLDGPVLPAAEGFAGTPDYVKSLSYGHANDGEVLVAYAMNGEALPMLNGFPLRLIVPGWYGTYWVKALNEITVLNKPFDGFWMSKAYRVPNTPDFQELPDKLAKTTIPINRMTVRSLFVKPEPLQRVKAGAVFEVQGLAIDDGKGIAKVDVSTDAGETWSPATLDPELGRYSWRRFRFNWTPGKHETVTLMCRATNAAGETQTPHQWNRSGYARNVIESVQAIVI